MSDYSILALGFSHIGDLWEQKGRISPGYVSTKVFDSMLGFLSSQRYKFLDFSEFVAIKKGQMEPPKRAVLLTFQGAWLDTLHNAYPLLKHYWARAGLFVATEWSYLASQIPLSNPPESVIASGANAVGEARQSHFVDSGIGHQPSLRAVGEANGVAIHLPNPSNASPLFNTIDCHDPLRGSRNDDAGRLLAACNDDSSFSTRDCGADSPTGFTLHPHDICKEKILDSAPSVLCNFAQINSMRDVFEIGSLTHTARLKNFETIEPHIDLKLSQDLLKAHLNVETPHLCWPDGIYDARLLRAAKSLGFSAFYTDKPGLNLLDGNTDEIKVFQAKNSLFWLKKLHYAATSAKRYKFLKSLI